MTFTLSQIAEILQGVIEGDSEATVSNLSKIEEGKPGTLSFLANPKYTSYIYDTKATAVIVSKDFKPERKITTNLIRVDDPYSAFAVLLEAYSKYKGDIKGISDKCAVHPGATIGEGVYIGDFVSCYLGVLREMDPFMPGWSLVLMDLDLPLTRNIITRRWLKSVM